MTVAWKITAHDTQPEKDDTQPEKGVRFGYDPMKLVVKHSFQELKNEELTREVSNGQMDLRQRRRAKTDTSLLPWKWQGIDWLDVEESEGTNPLELTARTPTLRSDDPMKLIMKHDSFEFENEQPQPHELDGHVDLRCRRRAKTDTSLLPFKWQGRDWVDVEESDSETTTASGPSVSATSESTGLNARVEDEPVKLVVKQTSFELENEDSTTDDSNGQDVRFEDEPVKLVVKQTSFELENEDSPTDNFNGQIALRSQRRAKTDTSLLPFKWHGCDWVDAEQSDSEATTASGFAMSLASSSPGFQSRRAYSMSDSDLVFSQNDEHEHASDRLGREHEHEHASDIKVIQLSEALSPKCSYDVNERREAWSPEASFHVSFQDPMSPMSPSGSPGSFGMPVPTAASGPYGVCASHHQVMWNSNVSQCIPSHAGGERDMRVAQLELEAAQLKVAALQAEIAARRARVHSATAAEMASGVSLNIDTPPGLVAPRARLHSASATKISSSKTRLNIDAPPGLVAPQAREHSASATDMESSKTRLNIDAPPGLVSGLHLDSRAHVQTVPMSQTSARNPMQTSVSESTEPTRTTVMLKNLPNDYTRDLLLELMHSKGFKGRFDFVYLPMDFKRRANLGYAFINFVAHEDAECAKRLLHGFADWKMPSHKVLQVFWSSPLQGLSANIERYRNSPVMHRDVPDNFKPLLFSRGQPIAFPPPTRHIKAPSK